ncbi:predicted protein [Botrytis cinerea T4]|uniref:Uncharacterized protein n=1 Tax=Botryotinia fuckeliana (strain T4) TaxID=999810 RepID=G2YP30_BOTF4|nr:predicted protein [Botrytis cinerea T4]
MNKENPKTSQFAMIKTVLGYMLHHRVIRSSSPPSMGKEMEDDTGCSVTLEIR